jgi:hypothetical protein
MYVLSLYALVRFQNAKIKYSHLFGYFSVYKQWQICHWCQHYRRQLATDINDTDGKLPTGVNDTGGKLLEEYLTAYTLK